MKAEEANKLSMDACIQEIHKVLILIEEEARKGSTTLKGCYELKDGTRSYLKSLGYDIDVLTYRDGNRIYDTISWFNK